MKHSTIATLAVIALAASTNMACVVSPRGASSLPKEGLPRRDLPFVAVMSGEMPGTFGDVARHSWIVANVREDGRERARDRDRDLDRDRDRDRDRDSDRAGFHYRRFEWLGEAHATDTDNPYDYFGNGEVAVHGVVFTGGDPGKMATMVACLERETRNYHDWNCGCWPGPNSNTFADGLIRTCGLGIELPATALGRDYRGPIGASVTEGRTGVQLETWLGGVKIGVKEGIGVDLAGLPLGVHFWPPGIEVPINPGRIGIDTSVYRAPDATTPNDLAWPPDEVINHQIGAASIAMALSYDRIVEPSLAGGLSDRAMADLRGHAVLGTTVGYAFGFDLGIGAAAPLGCAYLAHLHPAGIGLVLGDTGFVAVTSGAGTSGVSSSVRGALELPQMLRLELDIARITRLGFYGGVIVLPDADNRKTIETLFGVTTRLKTGASGRFVKQKGSGGASGGLFFGLERREIAGSTMYGASFGYEIGVGG